jgi:hypothetical protein
MEPGEVDLVRGNQKRVEPGTLGIIYATGGQYNIKPTDTLTFDERWLMIEHHDAKNTKTMYSWSHVIWMRTWEDGSAPGVRDELNPYEGKSGGWL